MATDQIKKALADFTEAGLAGRHYQWPDLPIETIEVTRLDDLNISVRVVKTKGQPRYFNVKVSEVL